MDWERELLVPLELDKLVRLATPDGFAVEGEGFPFALVRKRLEKSNPPGRRLVKDAPIGVGSCGSSGLLDSKLSAVSGVVVVIVSMPSVFSCPAAP